MAGGHPGNPLQGSHPVIAAEAMQHQPLSAGRLSSQPLPSQNDPMVVIHSQKQSGAHPIMTPRPAAADVASRAPANGVTVAASSHGGQQQPISEADPRHIDKRPRIGSKDPPLQNQTFGMTNDPLPGGKLDEQGLGCGGPNQPQSSCKRLPSKPASSASQQVDRRPPSGNGGGEHPLSSPRGSLGKPSSSGSKHEPRRMSSGSGLEHPYMSPTGGLGKPSLSGSKHGGRHMTSGSGVDHPLSSPKGSLVKPASSGSKLGGGRLSGGSGAEHPLSSPLPHSSSALQRKALASASKSSKKGHSAGSSRLGSPTRGSSDGHTGSEIRSGNRPVQLSCEAATAASGHHEPILMAHQRRPRSHLPIRYSFP